MSSIIRIKSNFSKDKYKKDFKSNIFNSDLCENSHNLIKVNKLDKNNKEFIPNYKDSSNAYLRKLKQLKGNVSDIFKLPDSNLSTISKNKTSSLGTFSKEIINKERKLLNCKNAKERYYKSLIESNHLNTKKTVNDLKYFNSENKGCRNKTNSFNNIDKSINEIRNNYLYKTNIFNNIEKSNEFNKTQKIVKNDNIFPPKGLFNKLNWNTKTDNNKELLIKDRKSKAIKVNKLKKSNFSIKPLILLLKNQYSNVIGTDKFKQSRELNNSSTLNICDNKNRSFSKLRSSSQSSINTFNYYKVNKDRYNYRNNNILTFEKEDIINLNINNKKANLSKIKKLNNLKNSCIFQDKPNIKVVSKGNNCINKATKQYFGLNKSLNNLNNDIVSHDNKSLFEIIVDSTKTNKNEIKRIFTNNGLHIFNIKESLDFINNENKSKLLFNIRKIPENNIKTKIDNSINKLGNKISSFKYIDNKDSIINSTKDINKHLYYPNKAKWDDVNLKYYNTTFENKKINNSMSNKNNNLKRTDIQNNYKFHSYKNNKFNAVVKKR